MKKKWGLLALTVLILLAIGGYLLMKPTENEILNKVDEKFTNELLSQIKGDTDFLHFSSKTKKYNMKFPKGYLIDKSLYEKNDDRFEYVLAKDEYFMRLSAEDEVKKEIARNFVVTYSENTARETENSLRTFLSDYAYNNEHKKIDLNDCIAYVGKTYVSINGTDIKKEDPTKNGANSFFALVEDKKTGQIVEIVYSVRCVQDDNSCSINSKNEEALFKTIYESIDFR